MKIEVKDSKENPMLNRKEIEGTIDHSGEATPSGEALKELLAKELKTDGENVTVDKIFTFRGMQKSKFWAKEKVTKKKAKKEKKTKKTKKRKGTKKEEFVCEECGKSFDSKRGLSIHETQAHGGEEDYEEILSGTISEAKEKIKGMENPDYERLLEVEKENKDRKGMKKYIENKLEK